MIIVLYNNNNSSTMSVLAVDNLLTSHTNIKVKDSIKKEYIIKKKKRKKNVLNNVAKRTSKLVINKVIKCCYENCLYEKLKLNLFGVNDFSNILHYIC